MNTQEQQKTAAKPSKQAAAKNKQTANNVASTGASDKDVGAQPQAGQAANKAPVAKDKPVPKITVQTVRGKQSHRRAGLRFTRELVTLNLADLDDAQLAALHSDPALIVTAVE